MSLFKVYTPKSLYQKTLSMIHTMFVYPPKMDFNPTSYFTATLKAHEWIKKDLSSVLPQEATSENDAQATIEQIHASLQQIEQLLFGTQTEYDKTLEGCYLYTGTLEKRLRPSSRCSVV